MVDAILAHYIIDHKQIQNNAVKYVYIKSVALMKSFNLMDNVNNVRSLPMIVQTKSSVFLINVEIIWYYRQMEHAKYVQPI